MKLKGARIFSVLLAFCLVVLFPPTARAAGEVCQIGAIQYMTLDDALLAAVDGDTMRPVPVELAYIPNPERTLRFRATRRRPARAASGFARRADRLPFRATRGANTRSSPCFSPKSITGATTYSSIISSFRPIRRPNSTHM